MSPALLVALAALALSSPAKGGPDPGPQPRSSDVVTITVWDDDPVRGAATCRQDVIDWAPAVCHVEPTWMAPDVTQPGWAWRMDHEVVVVPWLKPSGWVVTWPDKTAIQQIKEST